MRNRALLAVMSVFMLLSGCKAMETADKKMQTVDKKVGAADASFRKKVGLKPYQKDSQSEEND